MSPKGVVHRPSPTAAFRIHNRRGEMDAAVSKRRLITALSEIAGLCRGLSLLDYGMAIAAMTPEESKSFASQAQSLSQALRKTKANLEEASRNGTHDGTHA